MKWLIGVGVPSKTYSGTITFKCLLKTGEANLGAFHWPNKAALTLTQDSRKWKLNNWPTASAGNAALDWHLTGT